MNQDLIINLFAFVVLTVLWLTFISVLLFRQEKLQHTWQAIRRLPLFIQVLIWLVALPVLLGLWIWQTRWPKWLRLVSVASLAWITIYTFFPRFPVM